jgi:hypothetical protein
MIGYFETTPMELEEAATIDGATRWQVFRHVALPIARGLEIADHDPDYDRHRDDEVDDDLRPQGAEQPDPHRRRHPLAGVSPRRAADRQARHRRVDHPRGDLLRNSRS